MLRSLNIHLQYEYTNGENTLLVELPDDMKPNPNLPTH
jgi:hypothetical protein